jgi:MFS family permease
MRDLGFTPKRSVHLGKDVSELFKTSVDLGLRKPAVRWIMLAAPFASGVGFYVFYAMQPHLLTLFGDPSAYGIAGLTAAIAAVAQILGGLVAPAVRRLFRLRTSALLLGELVSVAFLLALGRIDSFWAAIILISAWSLTLGAVQPVRSAYLNSLIPSQQRATVLSFDSLMASTGGAVIQPVLGRVADAQGYARSFMVSAFIHAVAVPFIFLARQENARADAVKSKAKP